VDARNGCWVWALAALPGLIVSWSGACPAEGQGQGEWRSSEGGPSRVKRFSGAPRQGRLHGRGTMVLADGSRDGGELRHGRMSGQGALTGAKGVRYKGAFRHNRPDGLGAGYSPATGRWHRGQWAGGCFLGRDGTCWSVFGSLSECP
jgi:hypothetical protein